MKVIISKRVWVYSEPIDFRKQINGLVDTVLGVLEKTPDDGSLYVFRNRAGRQIKVLFWDHNGYVMGVKRLEKGRFDFPLGNGPVRLTQTEFQQLVSGMPMLWVKGTKRVIYTH